MLYRVLKPLSTGHKIGDVAPASEFRVEAIPRLLEVRALAELHAPPLRALPGWTRRAERLARLDIELADEFLECDEEVVATELKYKVKTIERWKAEVLQALRAPRTRRR